MKKAILTLLIGLAVMALVLAVQVQNDSTGQGESVNRSLAY